MTCAMVFSETCRREGYFHWTNSSASRRGLGDLLQSAGSDVGKSLFTSARMGTSHLCGAFTGRAEMCVALNTLLYIAVAIIVFLLLSLALFIPVAVMTSPPRLANRAALFCQRIGLALVLVGFAFTIGAYEIGRQLQQTLGGRVNTGFAVIGGCVTAGFSIISLAMDVYYSYRDRRLSAQQNKDERTDGVEDHVASRLGDNASGIQDQRFN
ncbi:hypothetical protein BM221_010747 [Beauveria bassiana]|uniref:Uncharacterized protein n=1 Tax=Beauveria bassiana TaxID=176275 RepID=A0A2N6N7Z5_BEABA|nr:hypothetical protein BM221_010747 [Beauveria bassiana]